MKIVIIGAGAMGCLYGSRLSALEDTEVFLIDVWKEHIDAINREGLRVETPEGTKIFSELKGLTEAGPAGEADLVLMFVKSTLTGTAAKENRSLFGPETRVLTLQNGLGNVEQLRETVPAGRILAGTTAHGATLLGPGAIRHAGFGKTFIGAIGKEKSAGAAASEAAGLLCRAGLEAEVSDNVEGLLWDKLLVNAGINALTAILRIENGRILDYPEAEEILRMAVEEGAAVARALGVRISFSDPAAHTREVCRATAANRSSMLQDLLKDRQTEISMINGAIVREGEKAGVPAPVNRTLTGLVTFLQRNEPRL